MSESTLRARAFGAGRWILVSLGISQIVRLANSLIMSRLLSPDAFGLMAIASAAQIMITLLSDIGLHQAIVQSPRGADRDFLRTAWTLQILRGGFIWFACSLAAICLMLANSLGWVAPNTVYADPRLPWVTVATASTAVILGFQSMKLITHNRRLELRHITIIEIAASIIGLCFASAVGILTGSVWAFVTGVITSALVTTISGHVWLSGESDRFGWEASAISELRRFGKWALLSSASMAFAMNGDRFLLGLWLSPTQLGNYSIAANLATLTEALGNRVFTALSFPAMSEAKRSDHWRFVSVYFRMKWLADGSFVGMAGFLFAAGPSIVSIMYDPRYALAGTMLQYLSFALLFVRYNLTGNAYLAMGRQDYVALLNYTQLASLFILVPTLYYGCGMFGAIIGIAFYRAPILFVIFAINGRHHLNHMKLEFAAFGFWLLGYLSGLVARYPIEVLHQYWGALRAGTH